MSVDLKSIARIPQYVTSAFENVASAFERVESAGKSASRWMDGFVDHLQIDPKRVSKDFQLPTRYADFLESCKNFPSESEYDKLSKSLQEDWEWTFFERGYELHKMLVEEGATTREQIVSKLREANLESGNASLDTLITVILADLYINHPS